MGGGPPAGRFSGARRTGLCSDAQGEAAAYPDTVAGAAPYRGGHCGSRRGRRGTLALRVEPCDTFRAIARMERHNAPHSASAEETLRPSALGFRRRKVGLRRATQSRRLAMGLSLEAHSRGDKCGLFTNTVWIIYDVL